MFSFKLHDSSPENTIKLKLQHFDIITCQPALVMNSDTGEVEKHFVTIDSIDVIINAILKLVSLGLCNIRNICDTYQFKFLISDLKKVISAKNKNVDMDLFLEVFQSSLIEFSVNDNVRGNIRSTSTIFYNVIVIGEQYEFLLHPLLSCLLDDFFDKNLDNSIFRTDVLLPDNCF